MEKLNNRLIGQWLIAHLVAHSLSVMKDPGSILGMEFVRFFIDPRSN
jgi:hypothetical protein